MGFGEVWWFLHEDSVASLETAMTAIRNAGMVVGNPATGVPQIVDAAGSQVSWDPISVGQRWAAGETVTVQLWVNRETDVLMQLKRHHRLQFDLDGMTTAEARWTGFCGA
jgi:hypothetical protein